MVDLAQIGNPLKKLEDLLAGTSPGLLDPQVNFEDEFRTELQKLVKDQNSLEVPRLIEEVLKQAGNRVGQLEERTNKLSQAIDQRALDLSGFDTRHEKVNAALSNAESESEAFRLSVLEKLNLDAAKNLWIKKSNEYKKSFYSSLILIVILLISPILFVIFSHESIITYISSV